jgi:hypothetical protein
VKLFLFFLGNGDGCTAVCLHLVGFMATLTCTAFLVTTLSTGDEMTKDSELNFIYPFGVSPNVFLIYHRRSKIFEVRPAFW